MQKITLQKNGFFPTTLFVLYLILFVSVFCSFRAVSSISIGLIIIIGIIKNKSERKPLFNKNVKNLFSLACFLFYLVQVAGIFYTQHRETSLSDLQTKTGLLFIPFAICCTDYINRERRKKLFLYYSGILAFVSLFCLISAFITYQQTQNASVFFYHSLVSPFKQHAVYFSIYVFIGILFLSESVKDNELIAGKSYYILLISFLSAFLLLLASKLVLVFFIFYVIYYFTSYSIMKKAGKSNAIIAFSIILITITIIFSTKNIIRERFGDLVKGDINILKQEKYDPGVYFNGLQFRLLQWRLVTEILNKNHSWITGVSPGDAQFFLNEQYRLKDMYTGDSSRGTQGYLIYNTHNQFLESLLQSGVTGLLAFLFICFALMRIAWLKKNRKTTIIVLLLLAYCFSESLFETQYSIFLFTFYPLFIFIDPHSD